MSHCDRCGALRASFMLRWTEAATLNKHGEPESGQLCRDCWPEDWQWPDPEGRAEI